jgi:hypothetical protein
VPNPSPNKVVADFIRVFSPERKEDIVEEQKTTTERIKVRSLFA